MKTGKMIARGESGFTLVEIAVVIIIVGLLVGGILKGQALVENSRVSTIVSQVGAIKAAAYTFHDKYNQFPGDMANATTAIPQCDAAHLCINGNGSGYIADDPGGCCNVWTTILTSGAGMGGSDFESIQFCLAYQAW